MKASGFTEKQITDIRVVPSETAPVNVALAVASILAGCSPYASTIGGWDAPSLEKRENQAAAACQQSTDRPPHPRTSA